MPYALEFVSDCHKILKMCYKAVNTYPLRCNLFLKVNNNN